MKPGGLNAIRRVVMTELSPARGLIPLLALLIAWQLLVGGPSAYFPAPSEWWGAALRLWDSGQLRPAFVSTVVSFLEALAVAALAGVGLGIAIGRSRRLHRALGPLLEFMRAIPPPVTVPIATLLIGYDEAMKLVVVTLSAVWPILLNTSSAAARVEPLLHDVARTFQLSPAEMIWRIVMPSVVPAILLGVRVAIPLAIIVTLLVEMLTSLPGIGALMIQSQRNFQSAQVYALLVVVGAFGFVVNDLFARVEAVVIRRWPARSAARPG